MKLFFKNAVFIYSYALLLVVIHAGITLMHEYISLPTNQTLSMIMLASWVLLIPLISGFLYFSYFKVQQRQVSFMSSIMQGFNRFLSLMACLVSILFVPIIIAGLGVVAYVAVNTQMTQIEYNYAVLGITILLVLLSLNSKQFAPILIISEEYSMTDAIDLSSKMVKGHFWGKGLISIICFGGFIALFFGHLIFRMIPEPHEALRVLAFYELGSWIVMPILVWIVMTICHQLKVKVT